MISEEAIDREILDRTFSWYQASELQLSKQSEDMPLKGHLRILDLLRTVLCKVNGVDRGMNGALPGDNHCLGQSLVQFHSKKVTPLTNPVKIMIQEFCKAIPSAGDITTAIKMVISIIMQKTCSQEWSKTPRCNGWTTVGTNISLRHSCVPR